MLIWLGVVSTILALVGMGVLFLLWFQLTATREAIAMLRSSAMTFCEAMKREAEDRSTAINHLLKESQGSMDDHAERIEVSNKEVLAGAKALRESWESLSTEIRTRYQNYDKAQRLALRQVQILEYFQKVMDSVKKDMLKPAGRNISVPSESDAAAQEELTESQKLEGIAMATAAAGLERGEFDLEG